MPTPSLFPIFMKAQSGGGGVGSIAGAIDAVLSGSDLLANVTPPLLAQLSQPTLEAEVGLNSLAASLANPIAIDISADGYSAEIC